MNIGSGQGYPAAALSNFHPHPFIFRGVPCGSMEGLLQSFKFPYPEVQKEVCGMVGFAAMKRGRSRDWKKDQLLYWNGDPVYRHGHAYQQMLDEAYECLFSQNAGARKALLDTNNAVLEHTIGKSDPSDTVLTRGEFCSRLTRIRDRLKRDRGARSLETVNLFE